MLSPHEFATLMLIKNSPDQVELDRAELDTLLAQQLVSLEEGTAGRRPCITNGGKSVLQAIGCIH
jgi:hypothetical protein